MEDKSSRYEQLEETEGVKITQKGPPTKKKGKTHTVAPDETLSHIALNYYGSAAKEKWMVIYEANKDVIGGDPNRIQKGMELFIPDEEK